jgi:SAM-dependent methyltransferase
MMSESWNPQRLLETSGSYWQGCALQAAVRLDIFTQLADASLSAEDLARLLNCNERGLTMLLRSLVAMGLLVRDKVVYHCPEPVSFWLDRNSTQYLGNIIQHHMHLVASWNHLDQAVRYGTPQRNRASYSEGEWREAFLRGMHNLSSLLGPKLVPLIDLGNAGTLLDVGGGPGTWAINFCRVHQQLRATVFDLPTSESIAADNIARAGMSERIGFVGGNFLVDPLGRDFDVAWLSQVLHSEGPDNAARLVASAANALAPGGLLLIHEFILNDHDAGPLHAALFSLNMLLGTDTGQSYTEGELERMCGAAGLGDIRRLELPGHINSGIIAARKNR